jgi:hypothetical protein
MTDNASSVAFLTDFIDSQRAPEHYHALCEHCATVIQTPESEEQVSEAKALAARLIVQLSDPVAPADLWATAVTDTVFDSCDAIKARKARNPVGKPDRQPDIKELLAMMLRGDSPTSRTSPRTTCLFGHPPYKDGWGRRHYETMVDYIKERAIKGSNVNPYGKVRIPEHHLLCPNRPKE